MNKFLKIAPFAVAAIWLYIFIAAITTESDYRLGFIFAAAIIVITYVVEGIEETWRQHDRKTERIENESGQDAGNNIDNPE